MPYFSLPSPLLLSLPLSAISKLFSFPPFVKNYWCRARNGEEKEGEGGGRQERGRVMNARQKLLFVQKWRRRKVKSRSCRGPNEGERIFFAKKKVEVAFPSSSSSPAGCVACVSSKTSALPLLLRLYPNWKTTVAKGKLHPSPPPPFLSLAHYAPLHSTLF